MARKIIDLDSVQPNGKRGETQRPAFTKINENFAEVYDALVDVAKIPETVDDAITERVPGRNLLINGGLQFWQRRNSGRVGSGAGTLGAETFFADRFSNSALNCSQDIQRVVYDGQQIGYPDDTRSILVCTVSGAVASSGAWMGQRIEGVRSAGGAITISVWANGDVAGRKVGVRVIQDFGTGGSPAAQTSTEAGVLTLTTGATRQSLTVTLPSTKGKQLGSNGNDHIYVVFDLCAGGYGGALAGQNGSFGFTQFQVESGRAATRFDWRPPGVELALCQRYYEKSYNLEIQPNTPHNEGREAFSLNTQGVAHYQSVRFQVSKRAHPYVMIISADTTQQDGHIAEDNVSRVPCLVNYASPSGYEVSWTNNPGRWGGWWHWWADAEL
ncbi:MULTISPECIES: hypothetical protein [Stenotrophomonas]|uniref:Ig-like domain-containing protein n=1 Tax=Stenotrophomonas lactitubi TaxID=2045214 RepID=A0AAW4GDC5_9GAMM|nr:MULTISPECIES: hypothetical protein [Stenotrophomonas]MBM9912444.1 hypothetical protein [Stenotrophomonas lactitubi]MBM9923292.1 hypothetical protein [Stenotrophomonas lactitubi]MBM9938093.1 hypothetical protein [Stenotrophomonas lactitubi]